MANIEIETSTDSVEEVQEAMGAAVEIEESPLPEATEEQPEEEKPAEESAEEESEKTDDEEEAPEVEEKAEEKPVKKAVPQTVPRSRLNEEIRKRKDLEQQLRERREPAAVKAEAPSESNEPQTFSGKPEPKIEDYLDKPDKYPDPYAALIKDHSKWTREETLAEVEANKVQESADAAKAKLVGAFNKHVETAIKERIPDYTEVVSESEVQISGLMERRIFKSPYGPDMLYALTQDPDRAAEILAMEIDDQVEAMIELESEIKAAIPAVKKPAGTPPNGGPPRKPVVPKTSSSAPPPPSRIKGAGPVPKSERELAGPEDRTGVDIEFSPELERLDRAKKKT